MLEQIQKAVDYIKNIFPEVQPQIGIILGTGLSSFVDQITIEYEIPYKEIPGFVEATVEFHPGKLIFGKVAGKNIVCMSGRFHYYEGHSMAQVTFPVRVMKMLGVSQLFVSNAAGGLNPDFKESDLMIIHDHIGLFLPANPLVGENILGDRFPDMSEPYSLRIIDLAEGIGKTQNIDGLKKGVYVSVSGPNLETRAEYRLLKNLGADAVGMSTVPEVLVAVQMGMEVFAVSVITDMCIPETLKKAEIQNILAAARKAEPVLNQLFVGLIQAS